MILQMLEAEQEQLWPLIFDGADGSLVNPGKRVNVWIGSENPLEPMRNCALVTATYSRGNVPVGSIGMLGPTRMVYENAITFVEVAADYLSDTLS
jgi:heat-inducible transcriptional repressor